MSYAPHGASAPEPQAARADPDARPRRLLTSRDRETMIMDRDRALAAAIIEVRDESAALLSSLADALQAPSHVTGARRASARTCPTRGHPQALGRRRTAARSARRHDDDPARPCARLRGSGPTMSRHDKIPALDRIDVRAWLLCAPNSRIKALVHLTERQLSDRA